MPNGILFVTYCYICTPFIRLSPEKLSFSLAPSRARILSSVLIQRQSVVRGLYLIALRVQSLHSIANNAHSFTQFITFMVISLGFKACFWGYKQTLLKCLLFILIRVNQRKHTHTHTYALSQWPLFSGTGSYSWNGVLANGPFWYQANAIKYMLIGSENGHFYNSKTEHTKWSSSREWTIKWPLKWRFSHCMCLCVSSVLYVYDRMLLFLIDILNFETCSTFERAIFLHKHTYTFSWACISWSFLTTLFPVNKTRYFQRFIHLEHAYCSAWPTLTENFFLSLLCFCARYFFLFFWILVVGEFVFVLKMPQ